MIDFIKFSVPATYRDRFVDTPKFQVADEVDLLTGELKGLPTGEFKGMKIEIFKRQIVIQGSIHKFYNLIAEGTSHNYNQFTYSMLKQTINWLFGELCIKQEDAELHNLEFGLNITISRQPKEFLRDNVVMLRFRAPSQVNKFDGKGYFTEYTLDHYYLKVYDKSKQYNLDNNLIRIETKTRKMKHIEKTGIVLLTDLLDKDKLLKLKGILMNHVSNLLIVDSLDFSRIDDDCDRAVLERFTNPQQLNRKQGRDKKAAMTRLLRTLERNDLLNLKTEIMLKISKAWDQCLNDEPRFENPPKPLNPDSDLRIKSGSQNSPIYIE